MTQQLCQDLRTGGEQLVLRVLEDIALGLDSERYLDHRTESQGRHGKHNEADTLGEISRCRIPKQRAQQQRDVECLDYTGDDGTLVSGRKRGLPLDGNFGIVPEAVAILFTILLANYRMELGDVIRVLGRFQILPNLSEKSRLVKTLDEHLSR